MMTSAETNPIQPDPIFAARIGNVASATLRGGGARWVQPDGEGCFLISGDQTGSPVVFVYCDGEYLFADTDPAALFDYVVAEKLPLDVSAEAISHFLTAGLVPIPMSIFQQVFTLGIGDTLRATAAGGEWLCTHELDFPYFEERSTGRSRPDAGMLKSLLVQSVERQLAGESDPVLMLSSGKDSTALAVALSELGRADVNALTFVSETQVDEGEYAAELCRRLGLSHRRISVPRDKPLPSDLFDRLFQTAPLPCADDCQLPYLYAMSEAEGAGSIMDGSGNDVYVGHVPSRNDRRRQLLRVRNRRLAHVLESAVPSCTRRAQLLRNSAEIIFVLGLLHHREVERFYPGFVETDPFWCSAVAPFQQRSVFDFRAVIRGRHYDQMSVALKAVTAAGTIGAGVAFPWCDDAVADFYFNLPQERRFDSRRFVNKLLVREMLRDAVDYPDAEIGKRYFLFDRFAFFLANAERVRGEILACPLWDSAASEALLDVLYTRLPHNERVGVALNSWFLLSGWLNHNRWVAV